MIRTLITPILVAAILGNSSTLKDKPVAQSKYYRDIDIYKLKGINELNKVAYPCVEIKQSSTKKLITYHISENSRASEEYTQIRKGLWSSRIESKGDTTPRMYMYQYVFQNKLMRFNYSDEKTYKLLDASIMTGNKETMYFPESGLSVKPNIENFDLIKRKSTSVYEDEIIINNSILTNTSKKTDKDGRIISHHTKCYETKGHYSYVWWSYFGKYLKAIQCR